MIRYTSSPEELSDAVDALDKRWRAKAETRTVKFINACKYDEESSQSIWSTVKPAFMNLQKNKCVFCERQFENELHGKIEFDLEHFRPKSSVDVWPIAGTHTLTYTFTTGAASPNGYYWLAYDLTNYAASCKVCNSRLKSNYFPIEGARTTVPGTLKTEKAFLCYPIGGEDDDPEDILTFIGTVAVPKRKSGYKHRRGKVIIDFFDLNRREQLHRERAAHIILLGNSLLSLDRGDGDPADEAIVARAKSAEAPHAACMRSFFAQWQSDQPFARKLLSSCKSYYASALGTLPQDQ